MNYDIVFQDIRRLQDSFNKRIVTMHGGSDMQRQAQQIRKKIAEIYKLAQAIRVNDNTEKHFYRKNEPTMVAKFIWLHDKLPKGSVWDNDYVAKVLQISKEQVYGLKSNKRIASIYKKDKNAAKKQGLKSTLYLKAA
jgi:hypothetical protein